jgi:tetratricopeptide (TPR) repeat protein
VTFLVALIVAVLVGVAHATPAQDLAAANKSFREGQYDDARRRYGDLLYPPPPKLADQNDLVEAYVNLGVCRLETGDEEGAKVEFEKALQLDPNRQLDTLVITNKKAIVLFDNTKADLRVRAEREANARREADEKERLRKLRASIIGVQANVYALTFVPGAGQIQNGHKLKGALILGGEAITFGTSFGIWYYLVNKYGIRSTSVPLEDGPRVRRLQQIEIGAGIAFWALAIYSAIDANYYFKKQTRAQIDESLLPPELREVPPPPKKKPKTSFHIVPMLSPDGVGVGIGWEN